MASLEKTVKAPHSFNEADDDQFPEKFDSDDYACNHKVVIDVIAKMLSELVIIAYIESCC